MSSRFHIAVIVMGVFAPAVQAANTVSTKYDGIYTGQATPNAILSPATSCEPLVVGKVTIAQGNLRTEAVPRVAWITGLITEDGYVQGSMARPGGPRSPLDGRLDGDAIIAGFMEAGSGCVWLIELKRRPQPE